VRSEDAGEFLQISLNSAVDSWVECTYMLVEVLGNVRDIKVGVALVRELLELRVE
jgi:hypothetical protein